MFEKVYKNTDKNVDMFEKHNYYLVKCLKIQTKRKLMEYQLRLNLTKEERAQLKEIARAYGYSYTGYISHICRDAIHSHYTSHNFPFAPSSEVTPNANTASEDGAFLYPNKEAQ